MILAVDVGNTNTIIGGMKDGKALFTCRLTSVKTRTSDEYAVLIGEMSRQRGLDLSIAHGAIISCVVPALTEVICRAVEMVSGCKPLVVGPGVKTGLNIKIDDPSGLGGDLVAASVSAIEGYSLPCVMIHMGTATALAVLDSKGSYIGGTLFPGLSVSLDALSAQTSQLPQVELSPPSKVIGSSTASSIKSGLIYGTATMIDGLLDRFSQELGQEPSVVATGDWAETVIPHCNHRSVAIDNELLLRGLWMIYKKNRKI